MENLLRQVDSLKQQGMFFWPGRANVKASYVATRDIAASAAKLLLAAAKDNGLDNTEPRTFENTTPTSFREWCEEVLKPAFLSL